MEQSEQFTRLGVALAIGLLVGLERGWSLRSHEDHKRAAGLRSFALSGLLGGIVGLLSQSAGSIALGVGLLAYAAAFIAFHLLEATTDKNVSVTSVIAGLSVFLLGTLAVVGDLGVSVAGAVAVTSLLALREQLHRWVAALTWPEISSVLVLLAMTFLLLPLLPNNTIDPWDAVNPYEIWLLTILIAAVSFAGYVATKMFGDRMGIMMAAIAGGLASSTATTLALARMGRQRPTSVRVLSAGILLAGLIMVVRVAGVTLLLNAPLAGLIAGPMAAAGGVLGMGAWLLASGRHPTESALPAIDNPLAIASALKLGSIIAIVMLAAGYLRSALGAAGVLLTAAVSGLVDADAITISMARLSGSGIEAQTAAQAILVGVGINTLAKAAMSAWAGGRSIGLTVGAASLLSVTAGLSVFLLIWGLH